MGRWHVKWVGYQVGVWPKVCVWLMCVCMWPKCVQGSSGWLVKWVGG